MKPSEIKEYINRKWLSGESFTDISRGLAIMMLDNKINTHDGYLILGKRDDYRSYAKGCIDQLTIEKEKMANDR